MYWFSNIKDFYTDIPIKLAFLCMCVNVFYFSDFYFTYFWFFFETGFLFSETMVASTSR